jgi:AraC-like DNA-binding protein
MNEIEIIHYSHIHGLSLFFNKLEYRTPHLHLEWELTWVVDGILSIRVEDNEYCMNKGDIILLPPSIVHEFNAKTANATFLCLQMTAEFLNLPTGITAESLFPTKFLKENQILSAKKMLIQIAGNYFTRLPLYQMFCAGQCNLLFHKLLGNMPIRMMSSEELATQRKRNDRLNRIITYVEEHYAEKITLSDFAKKEGVTMNYLSHFVKDSLNQSFQSYVNLVRYHAACKLISTQKFKMKEVYKLTGFSDYKYFSNTFKSHCGLTPEEFSKTAISNNFNIERGQKLNPHSNERRLNNEESLLLLRELIKSLNNRKGS